MEYLLQLIADENANANILFIDDGKVHFDRALDLKSVLSGFVHNDFTSGKITAEDAKKNIIDRLNKAKENTQKEILPQIKKNAARQKPDKS